MLAPDASPEGFGNLIVLGTGRAGRALAAAARAAGIATRVSSGRAAAHGEVRGAVDHATVAVLAIPDDALAAAAGPSAAALRAAGGAAALLHLSGARDVSVLEAARPSGIALGSFHPLQTFSGEEEPAVFQGIAVAVDGDPRALAAARALARRLGARPIEVAGEARAAWHLGASLSANGLVALVAAGTEILRSAGLDEVEARRALAPLLRRSLENALSRGPGAALTGPVARGDESTVERHFATLARVSPERLGLLEALVAEQRRVRAGG